MIDIRNLQGEFLHLAPGQRLTIEQASTLIIDDEKMPGSFSYPIRFPLDDHNRRFLQYAYRPDSLEPRLELAVQVALQGHLYRRCTLRYRISDGTGDGYLVIDSGEVADKLKKLSLQEILPEIPFGTLLPITHGQDLPGWMKYYAQLPPGEEPFTFFPIRTNSFMDFVQDYNSEKLPGYQPRDYVNDYGFYNGEETFRVDTPGNYGLHAVPQFYLLWVLRQIMKQLGYTITGDWVEDPETNRLVILSNTAMQSGSRVGTVFRIQSGLHVPDMTAGDFLKAICQRLGLIILYNSSTSTCLIRQFSKLIKSPMVDLSRYQLKGYSVESADNDGFSVLDFVDEKDTLFQNQSGQVIPVDPKVVGKGKTEVQLRAGAPKMVPDASSNLGSVWTVPHMGAPGNVIDAIYKDSARYVVAGKRPNPGSLRLLSYRGMVADSGGHLYPLATSDGLDAVQTRVCNATQFAGQYGVWEQHLKRYFFFRNNSRKVTATVLLPISELRHIRLDQRIGLRLENQVLAGYLVQKLQFEASDSSMAKVRLEMQTLPPMADVGDEAGYVPPETVVWIRMELQAGQVTTETSNSTTTSRQLATILVHFFSDPEGTIPVVVDKLTVNFALQSTSSVFGSNSNTDQKVLSGSTAIAYENVTIYLHTVVNNSGEVTEDETTTYNLGFGLGYNVL